ncbi:MAG: hypothetical protein PVS2B1_22680 [Candidatus Dormibacteraceae bacterium]
MIAVERSAPETETAVQLLEVPFHEPVRITKLLPARSARLRRGLTRLGSRTSAIGLVATMLFTLSGGSVVNSGIPLSLQARAVALHQDWAAMRANGIPGLDLATLEQEWKYTQATQFLGVAAVFWWPGANEILDRWQARADAIWARDLSLYRAGALAANQNLHDALGTEPLGQLKLRLEELAAAKTPGEFSALRSSWDLEARLVPIDRTIAAATSAVTKQSKHATDLGIRGDPAPQILARAEAYSQMEAQERIGYAEFLTRDLATVHSGLQIRLDAAAITNDAFNRVTKGNELASLYGLDMSAHQTRIDANRAAYANALTASEFNSLTADLNQIRSAADNAIYAALSRTRIISGVTFIYQNRALSCEEAATSMALTHQGINLSQDQILAELGADRRPMYVDGAGRVRWGNPYQTFVGNVDGSESNYTGFGTFYPPLVRIAQAHGAKVIQYGYMPAATIYAHLIAGHPVVVFSTWDWQWHPRRDYLSFDGQWIPWIGPVHPSHVYTAVGYSQSGVLINDPLRGQYWVSKAAFEAGYSDFNEAIVFA